VQLKLNELIAAVEGASNRLIDVEDLTDHELDHLYTASNPRQRRAQSLPRRKTTIDSSRDPDYPSVEELNKPTATRERTRQKPAL